MITAALFVSFFTWAGTNLVKAIPQLPVVQGQKGRIRTVAGFLALASTVLIAVVNGNLETVATPEVIQTFALAASSWLVSQLVWKGQKLITK